MTVFAWLLLPFFMVGWFYLWALFIRLGFDLSKNRQKRKRPVMTTPLGKLRVGLDSPDLMKRYRAW